MYKYLLIYSLSAYSLSCPINEKLTLYQNQENIWPVEARHKLSYCISKDFKNHYSKVEKAMVYATSEWMRYANITFIHDTHTDNCKKSKNLFKITKAPKRLPFSMVAFFPNSPKNKRSIRINARILSHDLNYFKRTLLHELGHVLGLGHEQNHIDAITNCDRDRTPYISVTDYDVDSIMHYRSCGGTNFEARLSLKDQQGISKLYP